MGSTVAALQQPVGHVRIQPRQHRAPAAVQYSSSACRPACSRTFPCAWRNAPRTPCQAVGLGQAAGFLAVAVERMKERIAAQHQRTGLHVLHAQFQRPGSQRELLAGGILAQVAQVQSVCVKRCTELLLRPVASASSGSVIAGRPSLNALSTETPRASGDEQGESSADGNCVIARETGMGKAIAYRITLHTYRLAILFAVAGSETRAPNAGESEAYPARNGKRPAIAGRSAINAQRISGSATDTWRRPCSTAHWCRVAGSACCPAHVALEHFE